MDFLTAEGYNDILVEMLFISMFIRPGHWTFAIAAELADGMNLLACTLTGYLDGMARMDAEGKAVKDMLLEILDHTVVHDFLSVRGLHEIYLHDHLDFSTSIGIKGTSIL